MEEHFLAIGSIQKCLSILVRLRRSSDWIAFFELFDYVLASSLKKGPTLCHDIGCLSGERLHGDGQVVLEPLCGKSHVCQLHRGVTAVDAGCSRLGNGNGTVEAGFSVVVVDLHEVVGFYSGGGRLVGAILHGGFNGQIPIQLFSHYLLY